MTLTADQERRIAAAVKNPLAGEYVEQFEPQALAVALEHEAKRTLLEFPDTAKVTLRMDADDALRLAALLRRSSL